MSNALVRAENVVVEFPIFNASHRSLKKAVLHMTTGGRLTPDAGHRVRVRAIDNASFEFRPGDRIGLIGHNGAGKTTLLRVLSGVYAPVSGTLETRGRIVSLLDISLGMDSEATGYENIFLRGVLMGLKPREIREKLDEIADFSELGDYLNMPVRTYSSGMSLRLAFAVSTVIDADILLMDEWLAVGDENFKQKAADRMARMVANSHILILASHSKNLIRQSCNRLLFLEHGIVKELDMSALDSDSTPSLQD
jgi:lipopolysaccharide transport system ATP-binding protein